MFVYIHFNVPPTKIADLVKNVSDEKIWNSHVCLYFCFYQLGLCFVTYTANEYSIHHFCVMIKDFSISFSRVIIVQDFETVIFYVLFGILCGDKCKYIDFRNIINFEVHLLFLVALLFEDKAFRKGLVDVYIFHQLIALFKTGRFQNNSEVKEKVVKIA